MSQCKRVNCRTDTGLLLPDILPEACVLLCLLGYVIVPPTITVRLRYGPRNFAAANLQRGSGYEHHSAMMMCYRHVIFVAGDCFHRKSGRTQL